MKKSTKTTLIALGAGLAGAYIGVTITAGVLLTSMLKGVNEALNETRKERRRVSYTRHRENNESE